MVVSVSVVVIAKDFRSSLGSLIEALDQQSLPTAAFEVVLVDCGSTDGSVERLRQLTTHRPNLKLVELPETATDGSQPWLPECTGEYVLQLRPDQLLFPEALERMHALAAEHDLDAVSARVVQAGASVSLLFTADEPRLKPELVEMALRGPAVMIRTSLLSKGWGSQLSALPDTTRVGVLASYPALVEPVQSASDKSAGGPTLRQDQPNCAWSEGRLHIESVGVIAAESPIIEDLSGVRLLALVRNTKSQLSYLVDTGLPLSRQDSEHGGQWFWRASIHLDVHTAALGAALPHGLWEIDVELPGVESLQLAPTTVAWTACPPAVINETIVIPSPVAGPTLQLDVGPTTWPLVTGVDPAAATVTETAAGSRLVLPLPRVYVSGRSAVSGQIALDQLRLKAAVLTDGSTARLEGFVSGLFGSPNISTQFGDTPMKPSGLCLEISGLGTIRVAKAKPAAAKEPAASKQPATAKKPAAKKPAAKKPAAKAPGKPAAKKAAAKPGTHKAASKPGTKKAATSKPAPPQNRTPQPMNPLEKVRRAVPKPLEPLAKRIAKSPVMRSLYRKVAKL